MADYSAFASPNFDPNEYANAILATDPYSTDSKLGASVLKTTQDSIAKEDISVAISKLTFGIDDVSKQIRNLVTAHHEDLLTQASNANALSGTLISVRAGLSDLDNSVEKLRVKVHVPYETLQTLVLRLQRFHQASDLLRRTSRFVILARRLQAQMNEVRGVKNSLEKGATNELASATVVHGKDIEDDKERAVAKAALSIAELGSLLSGPEPSEETDSKTTEERLYIPLGSIKVVAAHEAFIDEARALITTEMENMVLRGLSTLNQPLLASSLQTAYNLRILPTLVQSLLFDLSQAVEDRIRNSFDLNKISKDASAKEPPSTSAAQTPQMYRSRVRTEPTNVTAPQWSAALWARLEAMFQEMADCCIKVYALEKVLKIKRDATSHVVFLDEAMKVLENKPSATFWMSLSRSLQKHFQDSSRGSTFLQQTLSSGYPRLLRLFHDFFGKITVQTDTVYSSTSQSPETILLLRSLSSIETLYLSKSSNKINDAVGQAFSGGARAPPGSNEGINVARIVVNELDAARFDPLLVKAIAKNAASCLGNILTRLEGVITKDRSATNLIGPSATPQQISNASLANFLYQTWGRLSKLNEEHDVTVCTILEPSLQSMHRMFEDILNSLTTAIRRELSALIAKLHRINFSKSVDPNAGMGGSSLYMKELTEKLAFIKSEIILRYNILDYGRNWVVSIAKYVIRTFVLHISIACPLGESGKLQMASDMTGLEFALNAFIADSSQNKRGGNLESIGDEYKSLRAMRPLFFLENKELASSSQTTGLSPLIVLHHILVRSPVPLPHKLHGWQEAEYVRWVDEHSEEECWSLIDGGLAHWEKVSETQGKDIQDAVEYVELARVVLRKARKGLQKLLGLPMFLAAILRARVAPVTARRHFSSTARIAQKNKEPRPPQPPKSIDDSTSALDYKRSQRGRPPPLPATDLPRSRSAEEAVTNILYNTPPPSLQPFKKHILNCLVQNEPGVLSRVSGILAGRGFNIDSLVVCRTEIRDLSRMCIVLSGQDGVVEQARRQLEDLVPVWAVLDYTDTRVISRELLLAKLSILGPEYVEDQLAGGPTHEPRWASEPVDAKMERETALAHNFERSAHPEAMSPPITPSQALRLKHQHLHSISVLANQFGAKIVDVSEHSVIVELTAKTSRVEAFLNLLKPFGILEAARTGLMAMPRTPIKAEDEEHLPADEGGPIDASLLPPG